MPHVTELTYYQFGDLRECIVDLFNALHGASAHPQQAIYTKYSQPKQVLFLYNIFIHSEFCDANNNLSVVSSVVGLVKLLLIVPRP